MRWFIASLIAVTILLLTFPVLAVGSSDGPDHCMSALGLRTVGDGESCDALGVAVSLPAAVLAFVLIAWAAKYVRLGRKRADRPDARSPED